MLLVVRVRIVMSFLLMVVQGLGMLLLVHMPRYCLLLKPLQEVKPPVSFLGCCLQRT
jgi:hypothetical protein